MIAELGLFGFTLLDPWFLLAAPLFLAAAWRRSVTRRVALPTASARILASSGSCWRAPNGGAQCATRTGYIFK